MRACHVLLENDGSSCAMNADRSRAWIQLICEVKMISAKDSPSPVTYIRFAATAARIFVGVSDRSCLEPDGCRSGV